MGDPTSTRRSLFFEALPRLGAIALGGCALGRNQIGSFGYDVRAFGARGDGTSDDTAALQGALDACAARGGGLVVVPAGTYHVRPIVLRSRTTLRLEAGATLLASTRLADYPQTEAATSHESTRVGLVRAEDAEDVAIVGRGTIDGRGTAFITDDLTYPGRDFDRSVTRQGQGFMKPGTVFEHGPFRRGDDRPGNLVHLQRCRNVHVEGITLKNSPTWTSHYAHCTDVYLHALHIHTRDHQLRIPNDDGIDIEHCRRVRIVGCDIETGDDPIAVFSSEDVSVSTCTLTTRSTGVRVGFNGPDIRNCTFDNLVIRGANRGLSLFVRDVGSVEDVLFSNIVIETQHHSGRWWGNAEPIHVSALRRKGQPGAPGRIRNLGFVNIHATGQAGMLLHGSPESWLEDIHFAHVRMHVVPGPLQKDYGGNFDLRDTGDPATAIVAADIPALYARYVRGLRLQDFRVTWADGLPDYFSHGVAIEDFEEVTLEGVRARQAHGRGAAIWLRRGRDAAVRHGRAAPGTDVFLDHDGVADGVLFQGNDTRAARQAAVPGGLRQG